MELKFEWKSLVKTLQIYPGSYCLLTIVSSDEIWAHSFIEKALEEAKTYKFKLLQNLIHWLQEKGLFGRRFQEIRSQRKIIHNRLRIFSIQSLTFHDCKGVFWKSDQSSNRKLLLDLWFIQICIICWYWESQIQV